jgi:hypothetical protein
MAKSSPVMTAAAEGVVLLKPVRNCCSEEMKQRK